MARALLIDLDDTLIDDRGAMAASVLRFRGRHGLLAHQPDDLVASRWDAAGRALWVKLAMGQVGFQEQRRIRLREVFELVLQDDEADALYDNYLLDYEHCWALLPGVDDFLEATAHLPRIIVTNGQREMARRKFEKLGLAPHFSGIVTPDDCGASKPDPKIFAHALAHLGVDACDAMMIGDNLEADIHPAMALGMKTFHVDASHPERSIRHAWPNTRLG